MISLFEALENGASLESIVALLDRGEFSLDLQEPDFGLTALLLVIAAPTREDAAMELIRRGANVNLAMGFGVTPMMAACYLNLHSIASALFQAGAQVDREISPVEDIAAGIDIFSSVLNIVMGSFYFKFKQIIDALFSS
jgi:hypothetical protein